MAKTSSTRQSVVKERRQTVQRELLEIFEAFYVEDNTVGTSKKKEKYSELREPPFKQKDLVQYFMNKHRDLMENRGSLTALVQREAKKLGESNPAAKEIINFKQHKSSNLESPYPSRVSNADQFKDIIDRLNALEEFKRKFQKLLISGLPEPEISESANEE
jgi:nicotinamide mononucleotide adenylyltransferase